MADFKTDGKTIFTIFVGAIIAATLIVAIADQVNLTTSTFRVDNVTVTAPAVNATLDLTGRELISRLGITNESQPNLTNQLTLQTGTGTTGLRSVQLTINDTSSNYAGVSVNVSYTYNPDGYVSDPGGRSITLLITLFAALAILIFVIVVLFQGTLKAIIERG